MNERNGFPQTYYSVQHRPLADVLQLLGPRVSAYAPSRDLLVLRGPVFLTGYQGFCVVCPRGGWYALLPDAAGLSRALGQKIMGEFWQIRFYD